MRFLRDALITVLAVLVVIVATAYVKVKDGGLSATEKPGRVESVVARRLLRLAIPAEAHTLTNPHAQDPRTWHEAADHYGDHCGICHGRDGHGRTEIGGNMYPNVPDLAAPAVQQLSDGDLFYIIQNGVRWSGMPAWQREHTPDETWKLVSFIRQVPSLTEEDLHGMEATEHEADHRHQHHDADRKPGQKAAPPHR